MGLTVSCFQVLFTDFCMHFCNVEKTTSGSPDFPTNPLAPSLKALRALSFSSATVKIMKGVSSSFSRSILSRSKPSFTGICMSHIIASGLFCFIFSSASSTEEADSTL